jgi:hypothetical protein
MACVNFKHSIDHHAWPQNGNLAIEACQRACGYCSLEVQSSNTLRKHVARCHLGPGRAVHGEVNLMPGKIGRPPPLPKDIAFAPLMPTVAATGNHDGLLTPAPTTSPDPGSDDAAPADLAEDNTARKEASLEAVMSMLHQLDQHVVELTEALRESIPGSLQRGNNELNGSAANKAELGASTLRSKVQSMVSGKGKQVASGSRSSGHNGKGPRHISVRGERSSSAVSAVPRGARDKIMHPRSYSGQLRG